MDGRVIILKKAMQNALIAITIKVHIIADKSNFVAEIGV